MQLDQLVRGLPGADLVLQGLGDYQAGRRSESGWLIAMAPERFVVAGLLRQVTPGWEEPERHLYRLLRKQGGDAYSRYNVLRRELDSFLAALGPRLRCGPASRK